jgi:glucokinase
LTAAAPVGQHRDMSTAAGVDLGGTKIQGVVVDQHGKRLGEARGRTPTTGGPKAVVAEIADVVRAAAKDARTSAGKLTGIGIGSPGRVDPEGRVYGAANLPGFGEPVPLGAMVGEALGAELVEVDNDVTVATLAEHRLGAGKGFKDLLVVFVGSGVGGGLVLGGRLWGGANGAAGEIGYSLCCPGDRGGAADGRAPLEEYAGGRAIGERASRLLGTPVTAAEVFEHPDPRAGDLLEDALDAMAVQVTNMAILIDPARIAVGGGLMSRSDVVLEAIERRLRAGVPFAPELGPAEFVHDGPLRGAIALALDEAAG